MKKTKTLRSRTARRGKAIGAAFVLVYGPPCSGKTLNAEAMREHYQCDRVFDVHAVSLGDATERILVLAGEPDVKGPYGMRFIFRGAQKVSVREAARALGDRWLAPQPNYRAAERSHAPPESTDAYTDGPCL